MRLVAVLAVAGVAAARNKFCTTYGDGNYAFAGSCAQFFSCANGFGWLQPCPGDLLFDSTLMECVWREQVDCEGRPL
ncbi:hypothetical protein IWQ56_000770 [Coemansia nantahalensis]|uniref:Uncharacterized protein n=2 Tax=Coemansia TaxID=4863 RepID=A0ACC1KV02_9FUNG|nr:hypothetical protein IWQ57_005091 [Coemansia nantahalensis]KAJ2774014.1 hypothetical protein IWQ56_000770 [Coemansia nantahalensis]KAJ2795774.1 hypothetical protein H4R21_004977 [Coemansia helicoidea]